jgi:hypothetical protein
MARNSYKISFKDKIVVYAINKSEDSVPYRIIHKKQLEILNMMLSDIAEPSFSCTDEEFYSKLTPRLHENYLSLKSNEFKLIPNTT